MKSRKKKKKKRGRWIIFFILTILIVFLFKNRVFVLTAQKEIFNPLLKIKDGIFLNENAKTMKIKDSLDLPKIKGFTYKATHKKISSLYPCVEILKIIIKDYPEFVDSIEYIDTKDYKIIFKNKKRAILGLGNYEEKIEFLFKNYTNFKKDLDLTILTFKKRRL